MHVHVGGEGRGIRGEAGAFASPTSGIRGFPFALQCQPQFIAHHREASYSSASPIYTPVPAQSIMCCHGLILQCQPNLSCAVTTSYSTGKPHTPVPAQSILQCQPNLSCAVTRLLLSCGSISFPPQNSRSPSKAKIPPSPAASRATLEATLEELEVIQGLGRMSPQLEGCAIWLGDNVDLRFIACNPVHQRYWM